MPVSCEDFGHPRKSEVAVERVEIVAVSREREEVRC